MHDGLNFLGVSEGLLLAIASALSFGASDTFAALVSRRLGAIRAATGILLVSFLGLILVAGLLRPEFRADWSWAPRVALLGGISGAAYLSLVNALRLGPVSVVAPLGASLGSVVLVLAVLLLGDRPSPLEQLAVAGTTAGAVLVALVRAPGERPRLNGPGPVFALVAVAGYAVSVIGLQTPIREIGWLQALIVWRSANVTVAVLVFLLTRRRRRVAVATLPTANMIVAEAAPPWRLALPVALVLSGLFEGGGQTLRAFSLEIAPAWLSGVAGSLGPVVVVGAGVLLFGERLGRSQVAGIVLIGIGLVLLALA